MFQEVLDNEIVRYDEKLESELAEILRERQVRVTTAESMTGGLLSHRLMIQPGSSDYFVGGVVCYDNLTKINTCGVSAKTIRNFGLVSKEVVSEMLQGAIRLMSADVAVSITGIAGPPNQNYSLDQIGKVCVGVRIYEKEYIKLLHLPGKRSAVIHNSVQSSMGLLRHYLLLS